MARAFSVYKGIRESVWKICDKHKYKDPENFLRVCADELHRAKVKYKDTEYISKGLSADPPTMDCAEYVLLYSEMCHDYGVPVEVMETTPLLVHPGHTFLRFDRRGEKVIFDGTNSLGMFIDEDLLKRMEKTCKDIPELKNSMRIYRLCGPRKRKDAFGRRNIRASSDAYIVANEVNRGFSDIEMDTITLKQKLDWHHYNFFHNAMVYIRNLNLLKKYYPHMAKLAGYSEFDKWFKPTFESEKRVRQKHPGLLGWWILNKDGADVDYFEDMKPDVTRPLMRRAKEEAKKMKKKKK